MEAMTKQSMNNNQQVGWKQQHDPLFGNKGGESQDHESSGVSRTAVKERASSSSACLGSIQKPHRNLMPPSLHQDPGYEISRRSRSNSIAAGAIARLKNLPEIKLSLPPEDVLMHSSCCSSSSSPSACIHHPLASSPDSPEADGSHKLHHLPLPGMQSDTSSLHHRQVRKKRKVLDQKDLNLKPELSDQRRNSLPISDQLLGSASIQIRFLTTTAAGRRLSQVSSVVSAQIQSTIGWRPLVSEEEVADQAKCLAAKFVWIKLRKSGFCHKRFHLQRLRSVCNFPDNEDTDRMLNQVTSELRALSHELESAHPKVFCSVLQHVGPSCFKSTSSVTKTQVLVGQFLFSCHEVTWTHVAAFFTITAALALDSVVSGHHDFVMPLIESFAEFASGGDLVPWVAQEGGWVSISSLSSIVSHAS